MGAHSCNLHGIRHLGYVFRESNLMPRPQSPNTLTWLNFASEKWKENHSDRMICDEIMEEFGLIVNESTLSSVRCRNPALFPKKSRAEVSEVVSYSHHMNKMLRSSRKKFVAKELSRLATA